MKQAPSHPEEIGRRIRELRKSRNMTMVELAEMLGVSQPAISQWESGLTSPHRARGPKSRRPHMGKASSNR